MHVMPSLARGFGGPVEALVGYLHAGVAEEIEAEVVAPHCAGADLRWLAERLPSDVVVRTFPSAGPGAFRASPALSAHVLRHAAAFDVVHVHGLLNLVSSRAAMAARQSGGALVMRPFGTLSPYTFGHRRAAAKRAYFRVLDAPSLRSAAAVHFTTEAERDEAAWHRIDWSARSFVVPPPWSGEARVRAARARAGEVLFLSRLHPKKGVELLLDAWPLVLAARPDAALTVAGSGAPAYVERLQARAARLSRVRFAGFLGGVEKAAALGAADLFVLPSHHENFGVAVVEAVAAGLPVVISPDVQLVSWVLENGVGVVAARRPAELADAIVRVLRDDALRSRCAAEGASVVRRDFSPATIGAALRRMYASARRRRAAAPELELEASRAGVRERV